MYTILIEHKILEAFLETVNIDQGDDIGRVGAVRVLAETYF